MFVKFQEKFVKDFSNENCVKKDINGMSHSGEYASLGVCNENTI